MRIDRVKLIAEMARRDMRVQELADKATVSRATVTALRGGKSCNENSIRRVEPNGPNWGRCSGE